MRLDSFPRPTPRRPRCLPALALVLSLLPVGAAHAQTYSLSLLTTLRTDTLGLSYARGINDAGVVVGASTAMDNTRHVVHWGATGAVTDLGLLVSPYQSLGWDISGGGEICGYGLTQASGFASAFRQAGAGALVDLPEASGGGDSYAYGISEDGTIIGWTNFAIGCGGPACAGNPGRAARWVGTTLSLLPDLGGYFSVATNISRDGGMICGYGATPAGAIRAYRVQANAAVELPPLPGYSESYAWDVNNGGDCVGYSKEGNLLRATLWQGTTPVDLGSAAGADGSIAIGINDPGQIIGYSLLPGSTYRALLLAAGSPPVDLNSRLAAATDFTLLYPNAINDVGQIVGDAGRGDKIRGFVLTPAGAGGVGQPPPDAPGFVLGAPFPCPTRAGTTVPYELSAAGRVRVQVMDVAGRIVAGWQDDAGAPGPQVVRWNGRTDTGRDAPDGLYFIHVTAGARSAARKVLVAR